MIGRAPGWGRGFFCVRVPFPSLAPLLPSVPGFRGGIAPLPGRVLLPSTVRILYFWG